MIDIENLKPETDVLSPGILRQQKIQAHVLRLDRIDPEVSGNKWYKLKEYIREAGQRNQKVLLTFGGAYSNHILATAAACKRLGLTAVGIIRGEKPKILSHTLTRALELGMDIFYTSRKEYGSKKIPEQVYQKYAGIYVIDEGGYGRKGMLGAKTILEQVVLDRYTHILAAAGTGTTLAGLTEAACHQEIIGISVFKNNFSLTASVNRLLSPEHQNRFRILYDYHFGGYARYTSDLLSFMNYWYRQTGIPSDFVYTGKLFYAFEDLCRRQFFREGHSVLLIHSGGLQGNCSLSKGTLLF